MNKTTHRLLAFSSFMGGIAFSVHMHKLLAHNGGTLNIVMMIVVLMIFATNIYFIGQENHDKTH